jgi:hypothetical protein
LISIIDKNQLFVSHVVFEIIIVIEFIITA